MTASTPAPAPAPAPQAAHTHGTQSPTRRGKHYHDIPYLKQRLLIPEVWHRLGLEGQPATTCSSPFRPDKNPSFSIYKEGQRWKDYATGEGGDVIDFIAKARQIQKGDALRLFLELAGVPREQMPRSPSPKRNRQTGTAQGAAPTQGHAQVPHTTEAAATAAPQTFLSSITSAQQQAGGVRVPIQRGTEADWRLVRETRHLSQEAVSLGLALRTLTFGTVQGLHCWILTDADQRIAEARRLDGKPFPQAGKLAARKAHTLRHSTKSWPLGTAVLRHLPEFRTLLLVEGGPDYLAALHFAAELERWDVLPVAMLGRGTGTQIHPEALALMRGCRVRIYPHADADGGGLQSARLWAAQLHRRRCEVDIFEFADLRRTDGTPIKDLNDCTTALDKPSQRKLRGALLPLPLPAPATTPPKVQSAAKA